VSRPGLLITSGPTREYLDPVRYLSNGSSGKMGCALAIAGLKEGFDVIVVSGPVSIQYPQEATVIDVISTQEMYDAVIEAWPNCVGLIGAAAPCDFRPVNYSEAKIKKTADSKNGLQIDLVENPDILAAAGELKTKQQWSVGFALETNDGAANAVQKLKKKNCDFIVLNDPSAIDAETNSVSIYDASGACVESASGTKQTIADRILALGLGLNGPKGQSRI